MLHLTPLLADSDHLSDTKSERQRKFQRREATKKEVLVLNQA